MIWYWRLETVDGEKFTGYTDIGMRRAFEEAMITLHESWGEVELIEENEIIKLEIEKRTK